MVVIDDHPVYRSGLVTALESTGQGIELVGVGADGEQAVQLAETLRPSVALLDIRMRGMDGVEATRMIRARSPNTQVIILTAYDGEEYLISAIKAGAAGYLLKDSAAETIVEGIREVARGGSCVSPAVARTLFSEFAHLAPAFGGRSRTYYDGLSDREVEVLRELAAGKTSRQIAEELIVSVRTVENHIRAIYTKAWIQGTHAGGALRRPKGPGPDGRRGRRCLTHPAAPISGWSREMPPEPRAPCKGVIRSRCRPAGAAHGSA